MKSIFTLIIGVVALALSAQSPRNDDNDYMKPIPHIPLGTSYMECVYRHKATDTVLDQTRTDYYILEIGKDNSLFSSYGLYRIDSVIENKYKYRCTNYQHKILMQQNPFFFNAWFKDNKAKKIRSYDQVFMDKFVYEEPMPDIKWTIGKETQVICGHKCRKATGQFRGVKWTVWYSDIPVQNGPWKLGGLPGLILRATDADGLRSFEATGVRKHSHNFHIEDLYYAKISRKECYDLYKEFRTSPRTFLNGMTAWDKNGNPVQPVKRLFYAPLELE